MDLALNNLQRLICHKTNKPNQSKKLYKLYKFLFLVDTNWIKMWTNVKYSLNLVAKNSKNLMEDVGRN